MRVERKKRKRGEQQRDPSVCAVRLPRAPEDQSRLFIFFCDVSSLCDSYTPGLYLLLDIRREWLALLWCEKRLKPLCTNELINTLSLVNILFNIAARGMKKIKSRITAEIPTALNPIK